MLNQKRKISFIAYSFLLPAVGLIILFKLYPIIIVIRESLFKVSYLSGNKVFVGISNYMDLFCDGSFWNSVWVTLKLNLLINPVQLVIALMMGMLLNMNHRGKMVYRFLFFIPLGVSLAVTTIYWSIIFRPGNGIMNYLLNGFGFSTQPFFNSPNQAMWIIIGIASWKGCSFWMLFILAGLKNIPKEIYEAAEVEGAGNVASFLFITLPMLSKTILFVLVSDICANFMLFIPIFMITHGGPDSTTNVLMYQAYRTSMLNGDMGHGMAMIVFLMVLLSIVIAFQFKMFKERD
jgi:ABC-type sugar transport system permease subunit